MKHIFIAQSRQTGAECVLFTLAPAYGTPLHRLAPLLKNREYYYFQSLFVDNFADFLATCTTKESWAVFKAPKCSGCFQSPSWRRLLRSFRLFCRHRLCSRVVSGDRRWCGNCFRPNDNNKSRWECVYEGCTILSQLLSFSCCFSLHLNFIPNDHKGAERIHW